MSNLEDLYHETGIKEKPNESRIKPAILKFFVYIIILGSIIYWAYLKNILDFSTSQPYYFIVLAALFLYVIFNKLNSYWEIVKQNRKFFKP